MKENTKRKSIERFFVSVIISGILMAGTTAASTACTKSLPKEKETIYQLSTYDGLSKGVLDGIISLKDATKNTDFGIGTFEGLDGEMVFVDGKMYQVKADGKAYLKDKAKMAKELTPYIVATSFEGDITEKLGGLTNYQELQSVIDSKITDKNLFYAVRVDGIFSSIKVRSVPKQQKPYPTLTEALKNQTVFDYTNIKGTLVGYWCPAYVGGVNVSGFHLHFISEDRNLGGHVLEVQVGEGSLKLDKTAAFNMILPQAE